jgi:hypothetical protein
MATISEIQSLEEISYKSRIKFFFYPLLIGSIFIFAFLNFYPVGSQLKLLMKKNLQGTGCNPDFDQIRFEWFLPKIVISDVSLPAACLGRVGDPLKLNYLNLNFHFISFAPFGIPFKLETEVNSQPLTLYFVQGFGKRLVRIKDQSIALSRIQPLLGAKLKMSGTVLLDFSALIDNNNTLKELSIKGRSTDFQLPSQSIEGFTTPAMKVNDFYLEANSESPSKLSLDKFIVGDPNSPMRANFRGKVQLQQGNIAFSPMDLRGEIAFTESFKQTVPLVELFFQTYEQKDGFYQIRLGGTLGQPKLMTP